VLNQAAFSDPSGTPFPLAGLGAARLEKVSEIVDGSRSNDLSLDAQEKVLLANLLSLRDFQFSITSARLLSGLSTKDFAFRIGSPESEVVSAEQHLGTITLEQLMVHLMGLGFIIRIDQRPGHSWQDL